MLRSIIRVRVLWLINSIKTFPYFLLYTPETQLKSRSYALYYVRKLEIGNRSE